jgi:hypothetical protein
LLQRIKCQIYKILLVNGYLNIMINCIKIKLTFSYVLKNIHTYIYIYIYIYMYVLKNTHIYIYIFIYIIYISFLYEDLSLVSWNISFHVFYSRVRIKLTIASYKTGYKIFKNNL